MSKIKIINKSKLSDRNAVDVVLTLMHIWDFDNGMLEFNSLDPAKEIEVSIRVSSKGYRFLIKDYNN